VIATVIEIIGDTPTGCVRTGRGIRWPDGKPAVIETTDGALYGLASVQGDGYPLALRLEDPEDAAAWLLRQVVSARLARESTAGLREILRFLEEA
jgi:hypothetical protein